jgi:hypothetical protein
MDLRENLERPAIQQHFHEEISVVLLPDRLPDLSLTKKTGKSYVMFALPIFRSSPKVEAILSRHQRSSSRVARKFKDTCMVKGAELKAHLPEQRQGYQAIQLYEVIERFDSHRKCHLYEARNSIGDTLFNHKGVLVLSDEVHHLPRLLR